MDKKTIYFLDWNNVWQNLYLFEMEEMFCECGEEAEGPFQCSLCGQSDDTLEEEPFSVTVELAEKGMEKYLRELVMTDFRNKYGRHAYYICEGIIELKMITKPLCTAIHSSIWRIKCYLNDGMRTEDEIRELTKGYMKEIITRSIIPDLKDKVKRYMGLTPKEMKKSAICYQFNDFNHISNLFDKQIPNKPIEEVIKETIADMRYWYHEFHKQYEGKISEEQASRNIKEAMYEVLDCRTKLFIFDKIEHYILLSKVKY